MEIYGKFANIYDSIMTEVPYDEWLEIILDILVLYNKHLLNIPVDIKLYCQFYIF